MSRADRLALLWGLRRVLPVFIVEQKGPSVIGPTTRKPLEKKGKKKSQVASLSNDGHSVGSHRFSKEASTKDAAPRELSCAPVIFEQKLMINRLSLGKMSELSCQDR